VKVGDLVIMPGENLTEGEAQPVAVVLRTKPDGINRGTPRIRRVKVYWIQDQEVSWEPVKWLEVINASR
jgi:hypothetical protein